MRRSLLLVLALAACDPAPVETAPPGAYPESDEILAVVNGQPIPGGVMDAVTANFSDAQREEFRSGPGYTEFLDGLVTQEVLYQKAIEAGAHESEKAAFLVALAAREAIVRAHLDTIAEAAITDAAVEQEYEDRAVQYRRPSVHAAHILVRELSLAEDLKARLDAGEDFAALAAEHSLDPGTKDNGGDLGWFERERMLAEVAEAAFGAEPGAIVGPIESRVGYHILRVIERRDHVPLDEVRDEIEEALRQQALDAYVREVKAEAEISYPAGAPDAGGHAHGPGGDHTHGGDGHTHGGGDPAPAEAPR